MGRSCEGRREAEHRDRWMGRAGKGGWVPRRRRPGHGREFGPLVVAAVVAVEVWGYVATGGGTLRRWLTAETAALSCRPRRRS